MKAKFINICGIYFNLLNLIACMFMLGAFGKSAQIGLHV
jgi:NADH:ubiquinone oxidoreductase subunit 5 (subunit L)/multisubunit Na+/H+ antiporter MnhA subunit